MVLLLFFCSQCKMHVKNFGEVFEIFIRFFFGKSDIEVFIYLFNVTVKFIFVNAIMLRL